MDSAFRSRLIKQNLLVTIACLTHFCVRRSLSHVFVNAIMYFVIKKRFFFLVNFVFSLVALRLQGRNEPSHRVQTLLLPRKGSLLQMEQ